MTRNKIKHERIANKRKRNSSFKNRLEGLSKKAEELSVLCGAEVGFVIHTEAENNAVLWPSPEVFRERMDKFLSFSEVERRKKMVIHDKYLEQQLGEVKKHATKHQNSSNIIESRRLINELTRGRLVNQFDLREIQILREFTNKRMKMMEVSDELEVNADDDNNNNDSFVPATADPYVPEQIDTNANDKEMMDPHDGDGLN